MKGNNNIKEALVIWSSDGGTNDGLGTLIDWTGNVEIKVDNPDGSEESFLIGCIDDVGAVCGDKPELLLRGFDGEKQIQILEYIKGLERSFKLCIFSGGNCLYIEANLISFDRSEAPYINDESWQIKTVFQTKSTLKVYPSGLDVSVDRYSYESNKDKLPKENEFITDFEIKASDSARFWDELKTENPIIKLYSNGGNRIN